MIIVLNTKLSAGSLGSPDRAGWLVEIKSPEAWDSDQDPYMTFGWTRLTAHVFMVIAWSSVHLMSPNHPELMIPNIAAHLTHLLPTCLQQPCRMWSLF